MAKLKKTYGKLVVLAQDKANGRRVVWVQCACGAKKSVMYDALINGRTKSCGAGPCKGYRRHKLDKGYKPRATQVCTLAALKRMWSTYHHPRPDKRKPVRQLAEERNISVASLTYVFQSVRRAGGIDEYIRKVT